MQALKALTAKRAEEVKAVAGAGQATLSKAALEEARLKQIRAEEAHEQAVKEKKRKAAEPDQMHVEVNMSRQGSGQVDSPQAALDRQEVMRRLRALNQAVTLFGEGDYDRIRRLKRIEKEMASAGGNNAADDDDVRASGLSNQLLEVSRSKQDQSKKKQKVLEEVLDEHSGSKVEEGGGAGKAADSAAEPSPLTKEGKDADASGGAVSEEQRQLMALFKAASSAVAAQVAQQSLPLEEQMVSQLRAWVQQVDEDLERRPQAAKHAPSGVQTTLTWRASVRSLEALYERLQRRTLDEELRTGLWMIIGNIRERNYAAAADVYLRLAIGNAPWPIGVTQVGIHERSAREKISHVGNSSGSAHIMNDEATRKYFQAIKRLITYMQRLYPTDPSRCTDFDTVNDPGLGASGAGSAKGALLAAAEHGDWRRLGLPAAPHFMDAKDGSVAIPQKWDDILKRAHAAVDGQ